MHPSSAKKPTTFYMTRQNQLPSQQTNNVPTAKQKLASLGTTSILPNNEVNFCFDRECKETCIRPSVDSPVQSRDVFAASWRWLRLLLFLSSICVVRYEKCERHLCLVLMGAIVKQKASVKIAKRGLNKN